MQPLLTTARLDIYAIDARWLPELFELHSDPEVMRYVGEADVEITQTQRTLERMIPYYEQHKLGIFPALLRESQEFVGWGLLIYTEGKIGGELELGYRLLRQHWGKGYATEIGAALLEYARVVHGRERVIALTSPEHAKSQHVLEKLGFRNEGEVFAYSETCTLFAR